MWLLGSGAVLLGLPALVWVSHRMLTTSHAEGTGGSGGSDAFGGMVEAFEPARARADADLESHHTMRQQLPPRRRPRAAPDHRRHLDPHPPPRPERAPDQLSAARTACAASAARVSESAPAEASCR